MRVSITAIVCGKHSLGDKDAFALAPCAPPRGQVHRFGGGRGFIEQRGIRDVEPGEVADHRLEVEQRLQPALRNFRLIRRVGGVPAGVLEDVSLNDRRRESCRNSRAR